MEFQRGAHVKESQPRMLLSFEGKKQIPCFGIRNILQSRFFFHAHKNTTKNCLKWQVS